MHEKKVRFQTGVAIPAPDCLTVAARNLCTSTLALDEILAIGTFLDVILTQHGPVRKEDRKWNHVSIVALCRIGQQYILAQIFANVNFLKIAHSNVTSGTERLQAIWTFD